MNENKEAVHCGCPFYMAPELFSMETSYGTVESQKVDIWALGVVAFEMFFGRKPFEAKTLKELDKKYKKGEYYINLNELNKYISKEFVEFLNLCLQQLPKERANVNELCNSDFYNVSWKYFLRMNENELLSSLGNSKKEEHGGILIRIDEKYYKQDNEEDEELQ
jgi:serine/threonine protein kinase